ncbi:MAG: oxygen-independent coproporphyrinogen III oxidase [Aliishimia sp.]
MDRTVHVGAMKHENLFARHGLFDARVPRYTSYPPANRFVPMTDAAPTADWMSAIPSGAKVSFYMHIPFCRRLCWFCACRTQGTKSDTAVENYLRVLEVEIHKTARHLTDVIVERVHIGGGTPTLLHPHMITRLMHAFDAAFDRSKHAEFSVEIDPTEVDHPRLEAFVAAGMNRASLGVQDFEPKVQAAIGREQSLLQTQTCMAQLRALGVNSINLDILYGLPFQTKDTLLATVQKVIDLDPDRIAAFGYAHVPWMSRRQTMIPEDALPDPRQRLRLFNVLAERLFQAGYIQIGIDHFVKPKDSLAKALAEHRLHRNFQGYTDDASPWLIGLGASAISKYPKGYLHNATSTSDYLTNIKRGEFATKRGIEMTQSQHLTAALIEQLMCYGRIDLSRIADETRLDTSPAVAKLDSLETKFQGLVQRIGDCLHIPLDAYPMLRIIAAHLDNAKVDTSAHAVAV